MPNGFPVVRAPEDPTAPKVAPIPGRFTLPEQRLMSEEEFEQALSQTRERPPFGRVTVEQGAAFLDYLNKLWFSSVTAPFVPPIPRRPGESATEYQLRRYGAWKSPIIKGIGEFLNPLYWLLPGGGAARGAKPVLTGAALREAEAIRLAEVAEKVAGPPTLRKVPSWIKPRVPTEEVAREAAEVAPIAKPKVPPKAKPIPEAAVPEVAIPKAEVAVPRVVSEAWVPKTYEIRVEPEPLLPAGKKYVAYYIDGTPRYMSGATEAELKAKLLAVEPDARFQVLSTEAGVHKAISKAEVAVPKVAEPQAEEAGFIRLGAPTKPPTIDAPPPIIQPSTSGRNVIGLRTIKAGLSKSQELANIARQTIGRPFGAILDEPLSASALRERARVRASVDSLANRLGEISRSQKVFKVDKSGRIPALAGIDTTVPGAPTIQDVAARLPTYEKILSPEQRVFLETLKTEVAPYKSLLGELGIEIPKRPDVMDGGFYLPRGRADVEGVDAPIKIRAGFGVGGKKGFERPAVFASQAEGIEQGYVYASFDNAVAGFAKDAGTRALDKHIADFFKSATDEAGKLIGETPKTRMLRQNPKIANAMANLRQALNRLRSLSKGISERQSNLIDNFLDDPSFDDIDVLRDSLEELVVSRGLSKGATVREVKESLRLVQAQIKELRPEYKVALRRAQTVGREQNIIALPGLQGWGFPDEIANAANKILQTEGPPRGMFAFPIKVANAFNNLYRGMTATLDNSAPGIQGLLAFYSDPKAATGALKLNFRAWVNDKALGQFIRQFDEIATQSGRLTSQVWGQDGLRIGGAQTEFMLGQGLPARLSGLPGIRQANRAFGVFGDSARLRWADDMLRDELKAGRTLEQIRLSGDSEKIAEIANNMTGWSKGKAFSNVGDLLIYAPRFLMSRLTTVTKAGLSLRPGATLDEKIARRSVLKMIAYGTLLTVAVNEMLGNETDFRPIVKGKYNSNFMRIRYGGRDWSLFGTWDSLARAIVSTAGGHPEDAWRGMGSGFVTLAWDSLSGESFTGERVRDNPDQFVEYVMRTFMPFAWEELPAAGEKMVKGEPVAGGVTIVGEVFGAKSAPMSVRDVLDIVSAEKYGKRYDDLNIGERREVRADSRVVEVLQQIPEDLGTPQQQTTAAVRNWQLVKLSSEQKLRRNINAGMKGSALKDAIQDLKRDRFVASQVLFDNPIIEAELKRENQPIEDIIAESYWSVPLIEDLETGDLDFDTQKALRQAVLRGAKGLGLNENYISGTGPNTYRGKRFEDPVVREAIEAYEQAIETLRPYWELRDKLLETRPAAKRIDRKLREPMLNETRKFLSQNKEYQEFTRQLRSAREAYRTLFPNVDALLIYWGYGPTEPKTTKARELLARYLRGE